MQTIKFFTLGCKVNQYDTQGIREYFLERGFKELKSGLPAQVYVINTCTVTHRADSDSLALIRRARRENPRAKIIVAGCLTKLDADRIKETEPKAEIMQKQELGVTYFEGHTRAFLKIQDGCNNLCSYCKVPLVRGASRSRPLDEIKEEAERLAKKGFKEIVLCGICLGAYGRDLHPRKTLVEVIEDLEKIEGLLRIRLSSIEAGDVSHTLIEKMRTSKKLCAHLHIPIQSGDDQILKKMNRRYSRKDYLELIRKINRTVPDIAITTDVLVGFPGETEKNFLNTLDLVKRISPLKVHIFPYSRREGTSAANLTDEVSPVMIKERIRRLKKLADQCAQAYKKKFLRRNVSVLVEGHSKGHPGFWEGHSDNYITVLVKSNKNLKNQFARAKAKEIVMDCLVAIT